MRFAVCLHGGAVVDAALRLHPTDRRAIALARAFDQEIVVVELVGERGSAPSALRAGLAAGADRAVRMVEPMLASTDARNAGFTLASVLHRLEVDLVLFGSDANPEGLCDVPAHIAHHMGALYLGDVADLKPTAPAIGDALRVTISSGAWIRELDVPFNAVIGISPVPEVPNSDPPPPDARKHSVVEVMTFADFKMDPVELHRRNDLRGVLEPAPRPLVTLQSAEAVRALLRRTL